VDALELTASRSAMAHRLVRLCCGTLEEKLDLHPRYLEELDRRFREHVANPEDDVARSRAITALGEFLEVAGEAWPRPAEDGRGSATSPELRPLYSPSCRERLSEKSRSAST